MPLRSHALGPQLAKRTLAGSFNRTPSERICPSPTLAAIRRHCVHRLLFELHALCRCRLRTAARYVILLPVWLLSFLISTRINRICHQTFMDPERPAAKHKAKKRSKKQKKAEADVKYAYEDATKVLTTSQTSQNHGLQQSCPSSPHCLPCPLHPCPVISPADLNICSRRLRSSSSSFLAVSMLAACCKLQGPSLK